VKPGNLFRCADEPDAPGRVVLLDFGIAHPLADDGDTRTALTAFGHAPHSPGYAAPEQLRGEGASAASDVYALCAVAFELLVGRRPYLPADSERRLAGEAPALTAEEIESLPAGLAGVLSRGLAASPEDRFPDAAAMLAALDRPAAEATLWNPHPVERRAVPAVPAATRGDERRAGRWVALSALALAMLAGALVALPTVVPAVAETLAQRFVPAGHGVEPALPAVRVVPPPRPRWEITPVLLDSRCGDIFDVCRRVECSVANLGDADGSTGVEAQIDGPASYRRSMGVEMRPGERRMLVFEFREAQAGDRYTEYSCRRIPLDEVDTVEPDPPVFEPMDPPVEAPEP
jgi:hypothetical protein